MSKFSTCNDCLFYGRFNQDKGACYACPPTVLEDGSSARPAVSASDLACQLFEEGEPWEEDQPEERGKLVVGPWVGTPSLQELEPFTGEDYSG